MYPRKIVWFGKTKIGGTLGHGEFIIDIEVNFQVYVVW